MRRHSDIDAVRGWMLVWMTVTHLPTKLPMYVNQPFGFVSATDGFIFLSALFTGLIYFRLAQRDGFPAMRRKLWMRTLRLYVYHASLLAFAFVVAVPIAARGNHPALHNLLDFYFNAGAKRAIVDAALLIYRPPLLDILPMYIIFLLLTPVALMLTRRVSWKFLLGGGFILWLLAQFGLRETTHILLTRFGFGVPLGEMGAFDLWAWQFLWVVGLWCGVRWAQNALPLEKLSRRIVLPAAVVALALLALRYVVEFGLPLGSWEPLFDKWHFGVVRVINFVALAALLIRFRSALQPLAIRPLAMLGQASLQVFCVHLFFCFAGLTLMGNAATLTGWLQFALLAATLAAMFVTAKIVSKGETPVANSKPEAANAGAAIEGRNAANHKAEHFSSADSILQHSAKKTS
jgi:hypothetical protein